MALTLSAVGSAIAIAIVAAPLAGRAIIEYDLQRSLDGGVTWVRVPTPESSWVSALPAFNLTAPNKIVDPTLTANGSPIFSTVQAAVNTANPGDVIGVKNPWTYNEKVYMIRSGTAGNPIYIQKLNPSLANPQIDGAYALPGPSNSNFASSPNANLGPYPSAGSYGDWGGAEGNCSLVSINASYVVWDSIDVIRSHQIGVCLGPVSRTNGWFVQDPLEAYTGIKFLRSKVWGARGQGFQVFGGGAYIGGCSVRETGSTKMYDRLTPVNQFDWGNILGLCGPSITITECELFQSIAEGAQISVQVNPAVSGQPVPFQVENLTFTRNRVWDTWSSLLYFWNCNVGVIEQNIFYMTDDRRFWHYGNSAHRLLDFGSESAQYGLPLPADGYVGSRNLKVRNNIFNGGEQLVQFSEWASQLFDGIDFSNNTLVRAQGNTGYKALINNFQTTLRNLTLRNNLFHDTAGNMSTQFNSVAGTFTKQSNLWSHTPPTNLQGGSDIVNPNTGLRGPDYAPPTYVWPNQPHPFDATMAKLQETSPAVNAGTIIADLTVDFFGNPRPTYSGKYDIGAHSLTKPSTLTYTDTTPGVGTAMYRGRFKDSTLAWSSYSPVKSLASPSASSQVLSTEFSGVTIETINSYPEGREVAFLGTDTKTQQSLTGVGPTLWGAQATRFYIQALVNGSGSNPLTNWAFSITPDGLQVLCGNPPVAPDQAAGRIVVSTTWQAQSMLYMRAWVRWNAAHPDVDQFMALAECKLNNTESKVEFAVTREGGVWWEKIKAVNANGTGGGGFFSGVPAINSDALSYFSNAAEEQIFCRLGIVPRDGSKPAFGSWFMHEFAFRLQDALGQVQGNTGSGFLYAASAVGTPTLRPLPGSAQRYMYIAGRNMHEAFAAAPPSAARILFPMNIYTSANIAGLPITVGRIDVATFWLPDASPHPAGAV